jgi:hypothetical protein
MDAGARLVGLRKDGPTLPAEISLSPVTTATGHFTLTVIRDVTEARRLEDPADLAQAAVAADLAHHGQELLNTVVTSLYNAGVGLQAAADLAHDVARQRIAEAVGHLDDTISETVFTTRDSDTPPINGGLFTGGRSGSRQTPTRPAAGGRAQGGTASSRGTARLPQRRPW